MAINKETKKLIKEISKYLVKPIPQFITRESLIDQDLIDFLKKQSGENVVIIRKSFKSYGHPPLKWRWQHLCKKCNKKHWIETSLYYVIIVTKNFMR